MGGHKSESLVEVVSFLASLIRGELRQERAAPGTFFAGPSDHRTADAFTSVFLVDANSFDLQSRRTHPAHTRNEGQLHCADYRVADQNGDEKLSRILVDSLERVLVDRSGFGVGRLPGAADRGVGEQVDQCLHVSNLGPREGVLHSAGLK